MSCPLDGLRSVLFVPGHRSDMVVKTPRWRPDVAVVDLEDAVPALSKESARRETVAVISELDLDGTMMIRVNPVGTPWFPADVAAAARCGVGVVLPKLEHRSQLGELRAGSPTPALRTRRWSRGSRPHGASRMPGICSTRA